MRPHRRLFTALLLAAAAGGAVCAAAGCHNLQEHRRARWNYGPGMSSGADPYSQTWDRAAVAGLT